MKILQSYPIIKLFIAFLSGIILWGALQIQFISFIEVALLLFFLVFAIHLLYTKIFRQYTKQWLFGFTLLVLFMVLGMMLAQSNNKPLEKRHFSNFHSKETVIIARVIEAPQEKENTFKFLLAPKYAQRDSINHDVEGLCIAYINKDSLSQNVTYGDLIAFKATIEEVEPPQNPFQFDYQAYLKNKRIFHQVYIPSNSWIYLAKGKTNPLYSFSYKLREFFVHIFQENGLSGDEFAVATALILGYDNKLSYELSQQFAHAGAMHVLCVSGLHVGIIFLILSSVLSPLKKMRYGRPLSVIIILMGIWIFALITGLSSSVMRAATMFSFVAFGNLMKRKSNIYNTLTLSAFVLLIINTNLIYDVGFQLSYFAVIGIVAIQPLIYKKWKPRFWLLDKAWAILTVSIAAQIATLPLSLLYFHQFPNYFLISNLIVIPTATLIIYLGILVLLTYPVKVVSMFLAKILSYTIALLNKAIEWIDQLPYAFSDGIVINEVQAFLLVFTACMFYWFFTRLQKKLLLAALFMVLVFYTLSALRKGNNFHQRKIIVYHVRNTLAIDFITGNNSLLLADTNMLSDPKTLAFNIQNNWWYSDITQNAFIPANRHRFEKKRFFCVKEHNFIKFHDKTVAFISPTNNQLINEKAVKVDYLIITKSPKMIDERVLLSYQPRKVIFDSSNRHWVIDEWRKACIKHDYDYYSVEKEGAFIVNL